MEEIYFNIVGAVIFTVFTVVYVKNFHTLRRNARYYANKIYNLHR